MREVKSSTNQGQKRDFDEGKHAVEESIFRS